MLLRAFAGRPWLRASRALAGAAGEARTPFSINDSHLNVVAQVRGELWDLERPLPPDVRDDEVLFRDADSAEGQQTLRHSAAHLLGAALQAELGAELDDGPATASGFFYDARLPEGRPVTDGDLDLLTKAARKLAKRKARFEREVVTRAEAAELFRDRPLKLALLERLPADAEVTVYRCGDFADLCRGPHVRHTGVVGAFEATHCSGVADGLQRVSGVAFREKGQLKEWKALQAEAAKRDHRKLGREQKLFSFHSFSPGSAFMLPHGMRVYNRLTDWIRSEYKRRGYDEVVTPQIFKKDLWAQSGHLEHYAEDMYRVAPGLTDGAGEGEADEFGLKPMNCPGHCLLFGSQAHSYRDLPVRLAEFSPLHRNEVTGALSGLTRVRRFCQDDAHIFCRPDQIEAEISACLAFVADVYERLDMPYRLRLSTRPQGEGDFCGSVETWDAAEAALRSALDASGIDWELNEGDGAFYGPKIDVAVTDALRREHQCATIQLDFQLPERFALSYDTAAEGGLKAPPVIIHRAVLGSVERMMAILLEHTAGKWPFWLSPRQAAVLPVLPAHEEYAQQVAAQLRERDVYADASHSAATKSLAKRVREAQLAGYNYQLIVGDAEVAAGTVSPRSRENEQLPPETVEEFLERASGGS